MSCPGDVPVSGLAAFNLTLGDRRLGNRTASREEGGWIEERLEKASPDQEEGGRYRVCFPGVFNDIPMKCD
jgi:hypothetical protein